MPSDFELGLFTLLKGLQAGQAGYDTARDYRLRLRKQAAEEAKESREADLGERRQSTSERAQRMAEFTGLGAPLSRLERGEAVSREPQYRLGPLAPTAEETSAKGAYEDYLGRLKAKSEPRPAQPRQDTTDDVLSSLTRELDTLNRQEFLTPGQESRRDQLQDEIDVRRGLTSRAALEGRRRGAAEGAAAGAASAVPPKKGGFAETLRGAARGAGAAIFGKKNGGTLAEQAAAELERRKKGKPPTRQPYVRER